MSATPTPSSAASSAVLDQWAHRRGEPRTFALCWTLYLLAATLVSLGSAVMLNPEVYRRTATILIAIAAIGLCVLWPMTRLSQAAPPRVLRAVFGDVLVLLIPLQAVLWPQVWIARWGLEVVGALVAMLSAWTLLIGAVLVVALTAVSPRDGHASVRSATRAVWMTLVLLMGLGAPAAIYSSGLAVSPGAAGDNTMWLMTSPVTSVFEVTHDRSWTGQFARVDESHWRAIGLFGAVAVVSWAWLALSPRSQRPPSRLN